MFQNKKVKKNNKFNFYMRYKKKNKNYLKKQQKYFFNRVFKWSLKTYIRNEELLKYPHILKLYKIFKKWRKPKMLKWHYFRTFKNKKKILNNLDINNLKKFKLFRTDLYFWFKNLTKRQKFLREKDYLLKKKGSKKKNYFTLKYKNLKKSNFSLLKIKKNLIKYKLKKMKNIIKYYILFLFMKKKYILKINMKNINFIKIFFNLYKIIYLFKHLRLYYKKLFQYFLIYKEYILNKKFIYIRSKWLNRIKKKKNKKKWIYYNEKSKLLAQNFFNLQKKISFFFDYRNLYKQFFFIKIRTVDTNFFITLTNYKHEVIFYRSTGQVSEERRKKIKISPYTINNMIFDMIKKIKEINIKYIIIHINSKVNRNIRNVFRAINRAVNIKIIKAEFTKPIPHHFGTRKPKPKRL